MTVNTLEILAPLSGDELEPAAAKLRELADLCDRLSPDAEGCHEEFQLLAEHLGYVPDWQFFVDHYQFYSASEAELEADRQHACPEIPRDQLLVLDSGMGLHVFKDPAKA